MARGFQKSYRADMVEWVMLRSTIEQLHAACAERFPSPDYVLRVDESANSVWVTRVDDGRAVGIHVGSAERRGIGAVLESTARKLGTPTGVR